MWVSPFKRIPILFFTFIFTSFPKERVMVVRSCVPETDFFVKKEGKKNQFRKKTVSDWALISARGPP
jgi:hypothetical protein